MDWALTVTSESTGEPVSVADAKAHLRVDSTGEDAFIGALIKAAREWCETASNRAIVRQALRLSLSRFPVSGEIELPRPPLIDHSTATPIAVTYFAKGASTATTFSSTNYWVDAESKPGRIVLKANENWPATNLRSVNAVQVTYSAGSTTVPDAAQHAIKLLVGDWFSHRESAVTGAGQVTQPLRYAVDALIGTIRVPSVP